MLIEQPIWITGEPRFDPIRLKEIEIAVGRPLPAPLVEFFERFGAATVSPDNRFTLADDEYGKVFWTLGCVSATDEDDALRSRSMAFASPPNALPFVIDETGFMLYAKLETSAVIYGDMDFAPDDSAFLELAPSLPDFLAMVQTTHYTDDG